MENNQGSTQLMRALLFVALGFCSARPAFADRVALTNGDAVTGTIAAASRSGLTLDSELLGRVNVKWASVTTVTTASLIHVTEAAGQSVEGVPAMVQGRLVLRQTNGATVPIDLDSVRDLALATALAAPTWSASINAGVDVSRGNAETATVSTAAAATRVGRADRLGMFGTYLFSSVGSGADAVTTARASRGGMRYDHDVLGRLFAFGFGDIENDPLQLLDLRTVVGGGAGAHVVKTDAAQFNVFGGLSYANDSYAAGTATPSTSTSPTPTPVTNPAGKVVPGLSRGGSPPPVVRTSLSRRLGEFVVGQDFSRQLSDNVNLTEGLAVYPAIGDPQDYRVSFDLSLSAQINGWLQWNVSVADRYLKIPPAGGAVQNDTFISTGLGVTFGNGANGGYTGADARRTSSARR